MSPADRNHGPGGRNETGLVDAVALFFLRDDGENFVADFAVSGAAAQKETQIVIFLAEEASAQFSVGREPQPRAMAAEGLRDRIDQSDFTAPVGEAEFAGCFAALVHH